MDDLITHQEKENVLTMAKARLQKSTSNRPAANADDNEDDDEDGDFIGSQDTSNVNAEKLQRVYR